MGRIVCYVTGHGGGGGGGGKERCHVTSHGSRRMGVGNIEVSTDGWVGRGKGLEGLTCTLIL